MTSRDQLAEHERRIMSAACTGQIVDLRSGSPEGDDPADGAGWDDTRTVRAELLIELLTAERGADGGRPRAIKIQGIRITGPIDLEARTLVCPLLLIGCRIDEPINLNEATAVAIRLPGCHVPSITARQVSATGNLELNEGFTATSQVDLFGAHVGGVFDLSGAHLANHGARALNGGQLVVGQSTYCRGLTVEGEVHLLGARIGGQVVFDRAHLTNPGEVALQADSLTVGQAMSGRHGFTVEGEVRLLDARIGSQFDFSGAHLINPGGRALNAQHLAVQGSLFCGEGFTAEGEIDMSSAHIGGNLEFDGAHLTNPGGFALLAQRLTVNESMFCRNGFTAEGHVDLVYAHIGLLELRPRHRLAGMVDLTSARVGTYADDEASWPSVLRLRGFIYEILQNDRISVRDRLRWLKLHPDGYIPQIYDQLAAEYRRAGRVEAARRVGVAKQQRRRRALSPLNWLLYLTVGYGYRTWLAAIWLAALAMLGDWVFSSAEAHQMMRANPGAATFHPLAYTLDVLLPIVDLGQEKSWTPHGWALYWSWSLIAVGWILTTAVVAGLTGIFNRD